MVGATANTTGTTVEDDDDEDVVVIVPGGGFGGGPGQMPHCAPTYAAVLSLSIIAGLGAAAAAAMTTTTTTMTEKATCAHREAGRRAEEFLVRVRCGMMYAHFLSLRVEYCDYDAGGMLGRMLGRMT